MNRRIHIRSSRGQAMVEFVLVLPVLFVVLFGIVQLGVTFRNYVTLTDAVRAGARVAAVSRQLAPGQRTTAVTTKVDQAAGDLDDSQLTIQICATRPNPCPAPTWQHGDDVVVSASYPWSINLFGIVIASGNLKSTTTERVE